MLEPKFLDQIVFDCEELVVLLPLKTQLLSIAVDTFLAINKYTVQGIICARTSSDLAMFSLSGDFHLRRY